MQLSFRQQTKGVLLRWRRCFSLAKRPGTRLGRVRRRFTMNRGEAVHRGRCRESTEGKESHLADVTACAADWSGVGGPTRERKQ